MLGAGHDVSPAQRFFETSMRAGRADRLWSVASPFGLAARAHGRHDLLRL
jgi:hypothetical protein